MIPGLLSHLTQSTVFAGAAWLLALGLRKNRAQVRFWVYFTASMKFLAPFAALISLGTLLPKPPVTEAVPAEWANAIDQFAEPLVLPSFAQAPAASHVQAFNWEAAAFVIWLSGFAAIFACWFMRWRRMRALCNSASPSVIATEFSVPVRLAAGLMEPGVFGIFRQVLLLPEGIIERLSPEELSAILGHEWCHIRRRDNLTAAMHMAVQAVFWFHPIVWWLGARMLRERERACDEDVLRLGNRPQVYAAGILNVCRHYVESPLTCVSGVTGSNLKRRIEAILAAHNVRRLGFAKIAVLTLAAVSGIALPLAVGITRVSVALAQTPPPPLLAPAPRMEPETMQSPSAQAPPAPQQPPSAQAPPAPQQPPSAQAPPAPQQPPSAQVPPAPQQPPSAQAPPESQKTPGQPVAPQPSAKPHFDVASIRPCQPGDGPGRGGRGDMGANRGIDPELPEGVGGYFRASPGRLDVTCASVLTMIDVAYIQHGSPLLNSVSAPMREGERISATPKWALSARYTIHAETEDPISKGPTTVGRGSAGYPPAAMLLYGTMLRSLLEDRFQLKIHRETEEAPLYALTVAKAGLKLKPMQDGDCIQGGPPRWPEGGKPPCGWVGWEVHGPDRLLLGGGITLGRLARVLGDMVLDRNVMDRTGTAGSYMIRLEYAPDENTHCFGPAQWCQVDPNSEIPPGPTIFNALERQYGLKLETIRGPKEHIVIDNVQPPSEN